MVALLLPQEGYWMYFLYFYAILMRVNFMFVNGVDDTSSYFYVQNDF